MATEKTKNTRISSMGDQHPNLDEEIRCRAYELYESRGCEDGHDVDDWLRAEAEVTHTTVRLAA